jgi:hypothetical protein
VPGLLAIQIGQNFVFRQPRSGDLFLRREIGRQRFFFGPQERKQREDQPDDTDDEADVTEAVEQLPTAPFLGRRPQS